MPNYDEFKKYIEQCFEKELAEHSKNVIQGYRDRGERLPSDCKHEHNVPHAREVPLPHNFYNDKDEKFVMALYTTTLLHEVMHKYFRIKLDGFIRIYGSHYIPISQSGYSWRAAVPSQILCSDFNTPRKLSPEICKVACDYFLIEIPKILTHLKIEPRDFFAKLILDKEFRQCDFEKSLFDIISKQYNIV